MYDNVHLCEIVIFLHIIKSMFPVDHAHAKEKEEENNRNGTQ